MTAISMRLVAIKLSCVERLDMGSVLDGVRSVKWIRSPGVMLNP